jgi:predicted RNase H-like nuclease
VNRNTLVVGFDSAWTAKKSGAIVAALSIFDGTFRCVSKPRTCDFSQALSQIAEWQAAYKVGATVVLLDQPTIVPNALGQRPVENIVSPCVGLRFGGVQPASTSRKNMFGVDAPVWPFLKHFGGAADPRGPLENTMVLETYPVLALIAWNWLLPHRRSTGCLPKYNPERRKTYSIEGWKLVCGKALAEFQRRKLTSVVSWLVQAIAFDRPTKRDQDQLDACLCLLVGLGLLERAACLMVGNMETGYIVVPDSELLRNELDSRCRDTERSQEDWVRLFRLAAYAT